MGESVQGFNEDGALSLGGSWLACGGERVNQNKREEEIKKPKIAPKPPHSELDCGETTKKKSNIATNENGKRNYLNWLIEISSI